MGWVKLPGFNAKASGACLERRNALFKDGSRGIEAFRGEL